VRRSLVASGIAEAGIDVVTPAIDVAATARVAPCDWHQVAGISPTSFVVLAVSALTREKGMDILVDAMADARIASADIHCVIAGDGPERGALATRSGAHGTARSVHFMGHVTDPLPLIAGSGVLAMPSREEAFGSTILDALALGIPVIGTHVGGIPEALAHGGGVTVPPEDAPALAQEIHRLAVDRNLRNSMSRNASDAAWNFDLKGLVEGTVRVYRSVMERIDRQ
jgi:glycosyltransferase involved in cell wall biosynthesis